MKRHMKLFSAMSTSALLGCAQLSPAPRLSAPDAASQPSAPPVLQIEPVQRIVVSGQPIEPARAAPEFVASVKPFERAPPGPYLVTVAPNIYELRDAPLPVLTPRLAVATAGDPPDRAATGDTVNALIRDANSTGRPILSSVRVEVSNGVGIPNLARRTAERLAPNGVVTARLTNQPSYRQPRTEIQFGAGQEQAASALAALFPLAVKTVQSHNLRYDIQVRLVLGHDLAGRAVAAWLEPEEPTLKPQVSVTHTANSAVGAS